MATPPRISRTEVEIAINRIHWRHNRVDDPRRSGLGTEPRDVLEHLTRHSIELPRWVAAADCLDALVLTTWLWWQDRRRERLLLRRGLRLGLTNTELGVPLGITTRQGLRDRLDRLDALLAFDRPDEKLTREARRDAAQVDPQQRWLDEHRAHVRGVISTLLAQAERLSAVPRSIDDVDARPPDDAELSEPDWLEELRADLAADNLSPATISILGLALGPLRIAVHRAQLPGAHGLPRALRDADTLRRDFSRAGLGADARP